MGKKLLAGLATWALMLGMTTLGEATPLTITELSSADVFHASSSDPEWNAKHPVDPLTGIAEFSWGQVRINPEDAGSISTGLIIEEMRITGRLEPPPDMSDISMTVTAGTITAGSGLRTIAFVPDNWNEPAVPLVADWNWDEPAVTIVADWNLIPGLEFIQLELPARSIQLEPHVFGGVWTIGSSPVPEPAAMLLFGTGLAGLAGARLRKKTW